LTITDNNLSRSKAKIAEAAGATIQIVDPDKMDLALNSSQTLANRTPSRNNSRHASRLYDAIIAAKASRHGDI
jgi:hypothetical protein